MARHRMAELVGAPEGERVVLQGNIAFAVGCVRGGIHLADGYPGTPSTEVIDKGLQFLQDEIEVGWSVNEAAAVALAFGATMVGADAVVTMKVPGLFQAGDVVATTSTFTAPRAGMVLYIASDFVPSSTQYVFDPRYFLKSCMIPILEPRDHQEMLDVPARAAALAREFATPVAVLASGLMCHSEGLVTLGERIETPRMELGEDFQRFMNLPSIARRNYDEIMTTRIPGVRRHAEEAFNHIEWNDRSLGVVLHGITNLFVREVLDRLPVKPSLLSLGMTWPLPRRLIRRFAQGIEGDIVVIGDGLRFVQEELTSLGVEVQGKDRDDPRTEWSPEAVAERLGAARPEVAPASVEPIVRPPNICPGCAYRAFGLAVQKLRKRGVIVGSFGDIGCNTLLYFFDAIDTCACMGSSDSKRQGVVIARPELAGKVISVIGDSTECHSGLDSTRNAVFRDVPGVKVVLDNAVTAMTGGQRAPSSPTNLAGVPNRFDLADAIAGEGARLKVLDAFDLEGVQKELKAALKEAEDGQFTVLLVRGTCVHEIPAGELYPRYEIDQELCTQCDLCLICPGLERDDEGYPRFTHLCNGCGGSPAICVQRCPFDAIVAKGEQVKGGKHPPPPPPPPADEAPADDMAADLELAPAIRVGIRGVGGQGNLFLGKVLASVAMLSGYRNVIKGETHGMAQLGGPVISTFSCGEAHSPLLAPNSADVLMVLESSEVLRPGFLELLKPGGKVLLNRLRVVPPTLDEHDYPSLDTIVGALAGYEVVQFDAMAEAEAIGDLMGRTANVIALGLLSTVDPFARVPMATWRKGIEAVSPPGPVTNANLAAFARGRSLG